MEIDRQTGKFMLDNADRHILGVNRVAIEPAEAGILIDAAYDLLQRSSDTHLTFARPGSEREELREELEERREYAWGVLDMVEPHVTIPESVFDKLLFEA